MCTGCPLAFAIPSRLHHHLYIHLRLHIHLGLSIHIHLHIRCGRPMHLHTLHQHVRMHSHVYMYLCYMHVLRTICTVCGEEANANDNSYWWSLRRRSHHP